MPSAREDKARSLGGVPKDRAGGSGRVTLDTARNQHCEYALAAGYRTLDDVTVVGRAGDDRDSSLEGVELGHTGCPADADHLIPVIQRVLDHVLPEFSGRIR